MGGSQMGDRGQRPEARVQIPSPDARRQNTARPGRVKMAAVGARHRTGDVARRGELIALKFTTSYITDSLDLFRTYKKLAERAMEQVTDEQLFATLDPEMNSIAVIVKHMAGNM